MRSNVKYDLQDRLIDFSAAIISLVGSLPNNRVAYHLGDQLIRSGTSPALNYGEALGAESRRDFIHKLKIALKELRETLVSLRILIRIDYIKNNLEVLRECDELIAIFVKSIQTASQSGKV